MPAPSTSNDFDDLANHYSMEASWDKWFGDEDFKMGEDALAKGNWSEAFTDFGDGAEEYAAAALAEAYAATYRSIATVLRGAGL